MAATKNIVCKQSGSDNEFGVHPMSDWGFYEYNKTYDAWPRDEAGEAVKPAFLTSCTSLDMDAQMVRSMLEAYGIPSIRHLPGDGQFGELILGMSGCIDILVPETMLEQAQTLLEGEPDDDES